jgi:hypothetical protein
VVYNGSKAASEVLTNSVAVPGLITPAVVVGSPLSRDPRRRNNPCWPLASGLPKMVYFPLPDPSLSRIVGIR